MARTLPVSSGHSLQADGVSGFNPNAATIAVRMRPQWSSLDGVDHVLWGCEIAASGGSSSFLFEHYSDNNFYVGILNSGDTRIVAADAAGYVQAQVFRTYVYQWDQAGPVQRFYIGGKLIGTRSGSFAIPNVDRICIGRPRAGAGAGAGGDMEDWVFWSCALDIGDIQRFERGDSPNTIRPASRVAYVPIIGGVAREIDIWRGLQFDVAATQPVGGSKRPRAREYDAQAIAAAAGPQRVLPVIVKQAVQRAANW